MKPFLEKASELVVESNKIPEKVFLARGITKGMRNFSGERILAGLTNISENYGKRNETNCSGKIYYRGIDLETIIKEGNNGQHFKYEEVAYLLLFGQWPDFDILNEICENQKEIYGVIKDKLKDMIEQESGRNLMNILARCVLRLYEFDADADDVSLPNIIRQSLMLIFLIPVISVNVYRKKYNTLSEKEFNLIYNKDLSIPENILYMLREKGTFTAFEAEVLNICMILHAELGSNNSAFTARVAASTGTDTYSVIAAAIGSIKGPKHGGANIKAFLMMQEIKERVKDWEDENAIKAYLGKMICGDAFDGSGLIYGIGHAVFTISDPRTEIMRKLAKKLSGEKGRKKEFELYRKVEKVAPLVIADMKHMNKCICANVDFYSGFIYDMLGIPVELFTPMFVNARIAGWCAHRIEEMCNGARIIHPEFCYARLEEKEDE